MKTTVKLGNGKAIVVQPARKGLGVLFEVMLFNTVIHSEVMTPDAWGALSVGGEMAAEAALIAHEREQARAA